MTFNLDQISIAPESTEDPGDDFIVGHIAVDRLKYVHLIQIENKPKCWVIDTLNDTADDLGDMDIESGVYRAKIQFKWDQPAWGQPQSEANLNIDINVLNQCSITDQPKP